VIVIIDYQDHTHSESEGDTDTYS